MFHMASDFHISSIASSLLHSGWEADLTLVSKITIINTIITVITIILVPMLGDTQAIHLGLFGPNSANLVFFPLWLKNVVSQHIPQNSVVFGTPCGL